MDTNSSDLCQGCGTGLYDYNTENRFHTQPLSQIKTEHSIMLTHEWQYKHGRRCDSCVESATKAVMRRRGILADTWNNLRKIRLHCWKRQTLEVTLWVWLVVTLIAAVATFKANETYYECDSFAISTDLWWDCTDVQRSVVGIANGEPNIGDYVLLWVARLYARGVSATWFGILPWVIPIILLWLAHLGKEYCVDCSEARRVERKRQIERFEQDMGVGSTRSERG